MIAPDIKSHADLQTRATEFLEQQDFMVCSAEYHKVMPEATKILMERRNPTALYVRTRSDRIAIHRKLDISFLIEFKTNTGKYRNMAVEALPLAHHRAVAELEVECLYIYRDDATNKEGAFYAADLDLKDINRIVVPERWNDLQGILVKQFPNVKIQRVPHTNGSCDPFIIVNQASLDRLMFYDWRAHVVGKVEMEQAALSAFSSGARL